MLKRGIKNRKNAIILTSIFLVSFVLMTFNIKRSQDPLFFETFLLWVISPLQSLYTGTIDTLADGAEHYVFLADAAKEKDLLQREVDALVRKNHDLTEQVNRLTRIGQLINYQKEHELKSVVATVIGRDATQWVKMVFINKGTQDGVEENQAVVTNAGVVGHVVQAGVSTSKVLLIVDSRSAVDALFQEVRRAGVVVGNGTETCDMKYVPINAPVEVGDAVLSSGVGGIYPKGLLMGTVVKVTRASQGLFQDIVIVPSADFSRLEEVLVLLS